MTTQPEILDDGRVLTRCSDCQVEVYLDPGDQMPEGSLAHRYGMALARLVRCDECDLKYETAREKLRLKNRAEDRLADSGLPKPLIGLDFDSMISKGPRAQAIAAAEQWAEHGGRLVLHGPTGVGKTRLAACAANAYLGRRRLSWVSVAVLIAQLGSAFSDSDRREAVKVLTGEHPLVLDDFDKVHPSDWARNQLFAAVDRRIQAGADLLVTTNLKPAALRDKFGEPIASRLAGCKVIELVGPDYRLTLDDAGELPL